MPKGLLALCAALVVVPSCGFAQDSTAVRGRQFMGFDQDRTQHHFLLFTDGGTIAVGVVDRADQESLAAVRAHLGHLPLMFGSGNFSMPMGVHAREVPGTDLMAKSRDRIQYRYVETELGGRVEIVTSDPEALTAVHLFLRFQIADHQTGDDPSVRARPADG